MKNTLLCLITLIALAVNIPVAASEQQSLLDLLASGARTFSDEAAELQDCYVADEEFDALIAEIVRDIGNLDIDRSKRRVNFAAKTHKNHPQLKLIDAELDIQAFRFEAALAKIDSVISQCPLEERLHLRKAMVLIGMGRLDAAATEVDNGALQLLVPSQVAYVRGLIAHHRGDLATMRSQFRKVTKPKLLRDHVKTLLGSPAQRTDEEAPVDNTQEQNEQFAETQPATLLDTPLKSVLALEEAVRTGDKANVEDQIEAFVATYPRMALTFLFAYYAAYEMEDFSGADKHLDSFELLAPDYPVLSMLRGRLARAQGRFDIAVAAYEEQIRLTPGYRWPYEELVDAYYEGGRYTDLINLENRFDDEIPENYHQRVRTGNAYRRVGRFEDSVVSYDKAIVLEPNNSWAYHGKGNALVSLSRSELAKQSFEKALELSPGNSAALVGLARILRQQKQYEEAMIYAEEALRLWPNSLTANIEFAVVNYELGNLEIALQTCDSVSGKMVMDYFTRVDLAYCYEFSGDLDRALALNRELYKEDNQPHILRTIGQILHQQGRLDEARAVLKQALQQDGGGDSTIRQAYAQVLYETEAWPELESLYRKAVRLHRDNADVWSYYGDVQRHRAKYEEALVAYDKSLSLDPDQYDPVYGRAFCLDELERYEEAEEWFNRLLGFSNRALEAETELTKFYSRRKQYHKALAHAQAGLTLAESDPDLLQLAANAATMSGNSELRARYSLQLIGTEHEQPRHLSWAAIHYAGKGQLAKAEKMLLKALEMEPEDQHYWNTLGYTYHLQKRFAEALETYEGGLSLEGENTGILHYNTALTYLKLSEKAKAEVAFQKAKEFGYPPDK